MMATKGIEVQEVDESIRGFGENKAVEIKAEKLKSLEDVTLALWTACANPSDRKLLKKPDGKYVVSYKGSSTTSTIKLHIRISANKFLDLVEQESDRMIATQFLEDFFVVIIQTRDCRLNGPGKGCKFPAKCLFMMGAKRYPKTCIALLGFFPQFGYWKDFNELLVAYHTHSSPFSVDLRHHILFMYANQIAKDFKVVKTGKVSLAAKWCPKIGKSFDRIARVCQDLHEILFPMVGEELDKIKSDPLASAELIEFVEEHNIALWTRKPLVTRELKYRTVMGPLMQALNIVEVKMSRKRFAEIDFSKVPGLCLKRNKKSFLKEIDCEDRKKARENFLSFLEKAKKGEVATKGTSVFPHSLVDEVRSNSYTAESPEMVLAESQWKDHQENLKKALTNESGVLSSGLVLADVSGSMSGTPMNLAVAMAMLVSSVAMAPWKGKFLTFESDPHFIDINGLSFLQAVETVINSPWGMSTDLLKAFDLILATAVESKLPAELLPSWLMIISDMQFDEATRSRKSGTHFEILRQKFADAGVAATGTPYNLPHIIFWNARPQGSLPVVARDGATLISGSSPNLVKTVLANLNSGHTAIDMLHTALRHPSYDVVRQGIAEVLRSEMRTLPFDFESKSTDTEPGGA